MPTLDVISVNLWQILISLANLTVLFLVLKHFLYAPVKKVLAERQRAVDEGYAEADAEGIVRSAEGEAELIRRRAEGEIRDGAVELGAMLAERLLSRSVSEADRQALIEDFLGEVDHD